jgi:hypothetical protein
MPKPRIPFIFNYATLFLLMTAFIVARCKKDEQHDEPVNESALSITFSSGTISYALVDSAVAYLSKGSQAMVKRMEKKNGGLSVGLQDLSEGNWNVSLHLYSRVANEQYQRRYDLEKTFSITNTANAIRYTAPKGQLEDQWKTRVILAEPDRSIVIVASLDPADPFTILSTKGGPWNYAYIDRTVKIKNADGTTYNDGAAWECGDDCFSNGKLQFDANAFVPFSRQMPGKNWIRSEVYALLLNTITGEERNFYYSYNR